MARKRRRRTLWEYLGTVPDHRKARGKRYELRSVLAIALAAVLAGRRGLAAIARWAKRLERDENRHLLREFGVKRNTEPCHVTFHYVFTELNVKAFEKALASWVKKLVKQEVLGHCPIDGKVARGSRSAEYEAVHLMAAYSEKLKGVVAQVEVPRGKNEITAALALLNGVPLKGSIVTGDAILCQKKICSKVARGGGDYFFAVKENQPQLLADVRAVFEECVSPLREEAATA